MSTGTTQPIDYGNAPVVEVAISIQFDPPKGLNIAHLGAYWNTVRDIYPRVESAHPIPISHELFGIPAPFSFVMDTTSPECRLQMASADDEWMCQVQRDRIVINWRKRNADYPRYEQTSERFRSALSGWVNFLRQNFEATTCNARSWEVVYINRVEDAAWTTSNDWPKIVPGLFATGFEGIPNASLTSLNSQWIWESQSPRVRLYVEQKPFRRTPQGASSAFLNFIARGPLGQAPQGIDIYDESVWEIISPAIGSGRDMIVNTFHRLISDQARAIWRHHAH